MGWGPACAAEAGSHVACSGFSAEGVDVEGVDSGCAGKLGGEFCGEFETAAHADLPVSRVWEHTTGQASGLVGHSFVSEQGDAGVEANVGQEVCGSLKELAEGIDVEDHLRLDEFGSRPQLALKQSDLPVDVVRERVHHGADCEFVWSGPALGLGDK